MTCIEGLLREIRPDKVELIHVIDVLLVATATLGPSPMSYLMEVHSTYIYVLQIPTQFRTQNDCFTYLIKVVSDPVAVIPNGFVSGFGRNAQ